MTYFMREAAKETWNELIINLPDRHILQSREWGEAKQISGWQSMHQAWWDSNDQLAAAALILSRTITFKGLETPLRVMYIPRGPMVRDWVDIPLRRKVLSDLQSIAKQQKAIFIKMDPEVQIGHGVSGKENALENSWTQDLIRELQEDNWVPSSEQVQFRNTMVIDLQLDKDQLLANMKQKTRYNIRLATRRGVSVRPGSAKDLELMFKMYAETSVRDGFTIRNADYYLSLWKDFISAGMAEPLLAEVDGEPVAGVIIFRFGGRAWYMYGMSRAAHREKMPNYLLQWEAILRAQAAGCEEYDLWGAPDVFNEGDDLWGVYRFKTGLGAQVVRFIGAWDLPINYRLYRIYSQLLPRVLDIMRRKGENETRGMIQTG
jgi:peptidoglycan pentaglycine glycine transferase (the first glycine)